MKVSYNIYVVVLMFLCGGTLQAQKNTAPQHSTSAFASNNPDLKLAIRNIIISGNKKTKTYIIEREIQFKSGDSIIIAKLNEELEQARQLVYNTSLFTSVALKAIPVDAYTTDIYVEVKERWYIFPVPQFKWVDRNFNEWVKTYDASLRRVNYGIKFVHYNLTGRKDQLRIFLLNGYSRNISLSYNAPYSNRALTEGFAVSTSYTQARQIAYKTNYDNRRVFFPDSLNKAAAGEFISNNFSVNLNYQKRRGYFNKEFLGITYSLTSVSDTIIKLNPTYFNNSKNDAGIIDFFYSYQHTNVDNAGYSLKGVTAYIAVAKRGLGFGRNTDMISLEAGYNRYHDLGKNWYGSYNLFAKLKLPFDQPYINQNALGYGNVFLRGLDEYVVDGVASALVRSTLRKKVLSLHIPTPFKSKSHPTIPFIFYAKTFADAGYVYNKKKFDTNLNNRLLYTGGFGIDIQMLYDVNLRLEYSFNQLGQNGLFLHTQSGF